MYMKKKMITVIVFLVFAMFLFSCGKKQQNDIKSISSDLIDNEADTKKSKIPDRIEKTLSSGIKADAETAVPQGINSSKIKKFSVGPQELDIEKIYDWFIGSEEIDDKASQPVEDSNGSFQYYTKSGKQLIGNKREFVNYSIPEYDNIRLTGCLSDKDNASLMNQEFSFETRKDAEEKVKEFFRDMGINVYSEFNCYTIDYKWMQEENEIDEELKQELIKAGKLEETQKERVWNEDLNCYFFEVKQEIDHIPVTNKMREIKNIGIPAPHIYVVYSKHGIAQFMISGLFAVTKEVSEGPVLDLDQALELLDQKYNSFILEGEYTLTQISLEYVIDAGSNKGEYTLVPVWNFHMLQKVKSPDKEDENKMETEELKSEVLFNALDGTELLIRGAI